MWPSFEPSINCAVIRTRPPALRTLPSSTWVTFSWLATCRTSTDLALKVNALAVFHFHFAQIMQMRAPPSVLLQIFSDSLRYQDMTGITTIHQALGDINPHPGRVHSIVHVGYGANRAAVHPHAHRQIGMMF